MNYFIAALLYLIPLILDILLMKSIAKNELFKTLEDLYRYILISLIPFGNIILCFYTLFSLMFFKHSYYYYDNPNSVVKKVFKIEDNNEKRDKRKRHS